MEDSTTKTIRYRFRFPEGDEKAFEVVLNEETGEQVVPEYAELPEWTELSNNKCKNCPLSEGTHKRCPAAVSIVDIVDFFCNSISTKTADVTVETASRMTEVKDVPLANSISSILGLRMASSGCPVLGKLRPMVLHHLPFSSADETIYRALSMYVLAQYLRRKKGLSADWDLDGLSDIYQQINVLNEDFSYRFRNLMKGEATINALVSLDCFAQIIDFSISEQVMEALEAQFKDYLEA
ncbi:MAG: DUF6901 family protein [Opitutaceae bacterium]